MNFGYKIKELDGRLIISFKQKVAGWKRFASKLIEDRVILDLKNAGEMLKNKGDAVVYEQYNLWKSIKKFKEIFKKTKVATDLTLLNFGVFSASRSGELFLTYGHGHETECGEAYSILKNSCFLVLTDRKTYKTFILHLKEGSSVFIHPRFFHRSVCDKKSALIATFYPEKAGHDYKAIKNKGFPFHIFLYKGKIRIMKNPKFRKSELKLIEKFRSKISPVELLKSSPEKLKDILENPDKHKKVYFIGK